MFTEQLTTCLRFEISQTNHSQLKPIPGTEMMESTKFRKGEQENKRGGKSFPPPRPFPRSPAHFFACVSLTRHRYNLSFLTFKSSASHFEDFPHKYREQKYLFLFSHNLTVIQTRIMFLTKEITLTLAPLSTCLSRKLLQNSGTISWARIFW